MKKTVKILALIMAVVMLLSLCGCGAKSKIKGEWVAEYNGAEITLDIDKDTINVQIVSESKTVEDTFEYEFKRSRLIIEGEEMEYRLEDKNTLVLEHKELGEIEFARS